MKKHKTKSKNISANKKARKELESRLAVAFNEVLAPFGKAKKTDKVIEKFAKQLSKKISLKPVDDSITPFVKEDEVEEILVVESPLVVEAPKASGKKTKTAKTVS